MAPHHSSWQVSARPGFIFPAVTPSILDKASCSAGLLVAAGSLSLSLFPQTCAPHFQGCARLVPGARSCDTACTLLMGTSAPPCPQTLLAHTSLTALLSLENYNHDCKVQPGCGQGTWSRCSLCSMRSAAPTDTAPRGAAPLRVTVLLCRGCCTQETPCFL